jgi:hypothetical protein
VSHGAAAAASGGRGVVILSVLLSCSGDACWLTSALSCDFVIRPGVVGLTVTGVLGKGLVGVSASGGGVATCDWFVAGSRLTCATAAMRLASLITA